MHKSVMAAVAATAAMAVPAVADVTVGVSWSNFQEERWRTDEAAIVGALEEHGADYISADAQSSSSKQLSDIESLIAQGAQALIVLARNSVGISRPITTLPTISWANTIPRRRARRFIRRTPTVDAKRTPSRTSIDNRTDSRTPSLTAGSAAATASASSYHRFRRTR